MQKSNADILHHFYGLLLDMNFQQPEDDLLADNQYQDDPFIQKHLKQIRLKSAKYQALLNKNRYHTILAEFKRLKEIGFEEIKKLLNPQQAQQLQPLFRKFEELTEKDEASIVEDQELLQLISALKDKLDKPGEHE